MPAESPLSLSAWVEQTEQLIEALRARRLGALERAEYARREADDCERDAQVLVDVLAAYRARVAVSSPYDGREVAVARDHLPANGTAAVYLSVPSSNGIDHASLSSANGTTTGVRRSVRQMILDRARRHDGRLVLRDLVTELVEQGVFEERASATRNVTARLARLPTERCIRLERGVYQIAPELFG